MTFTSTSDLYVAELAIYLILLPVTAYLGWLHGRRGFLGYFYLNIYCIVRVVADIVFLLPANRNAAHPKISTAVLASVGLSPIMLALSGFIHEAHVYYVDTKHSAKKAAKIRRWLWFAQLQSHGLAVLGIVLVIIGSVKLLDTKGPLTTSETNRYDRLRYTGALMILMLWVVLSHYALYLLYVAHRMRRTFLGSVAASLLVKWIVIALPFIGLRCVYSVLYTFDHQNLKLNPITGALWIKIVFVVLTPLGAVTALSIGGWLSRKVEVQHRISEDAAGNVADKGVRIASEEVRLSGDN